MCTWDKHNCKIIDIPRIDCCNANYVHYGDVIRGAIVSQITSLTIVYSTVYSDADQRKHQSSATLAFVWGIHRGPVISPHKWPVTRKMFPFDDVIMSSLYFKLPPFMGKPRPWAGQWVPRSNRRNLQRCQEMGVWCQKSHPRWWDIVRYTNYDTCTNLRILKSYWHNYSFTL